MLYIKAILFSLWEILEQISEFWMPFLKAFLGEKFGEIFGGQFFVVSFVMGG